MVVNVSKESVPGSPFHGHQTVGTTKVQLTTVGSKLLKGVLLRCPGTDDPVPNTVPVWVGSDRVTADSNVGTGGTAITPGSTMFVPCEQADVIWCMSTAASQDISFIGS